MCTVTLVCSQIKVTFRFTIHLIYRYVSIENPDLSKDVGHLSLIIIAISPSSVFKFVILLNKDIN